MKIIKEYNEYNDITEDKIYKFSEYDPSKYNGNILVDQIMEWLRAKRLDNKNSESISVPLDLFFSECAVDRNQFLTFYNEMAKTDKVQNFEIKIENNNITFFNFKNVDDANENVSLDQKRDSEDDGFHSMWVYEENDEDKKSMFIHDVIEYLTSHFGIGKRFNRKTLSKTLSDVFDLKMGTKKIKYDYNSKICRQMDVKKVNGDFNDEADVIETIISLIWGEL